MSNQEEVYIGDCSGTMNLHTNRKGQEGRLPGRGDICICLPVKNKQALAGRDHRESWQVGVQVDTKSRILKDKKVGLGQMDYLHRN